MPELLQAVDEVAHGRYPLRPRRVEPQDSRLQAALSQLVTQIHEAFPGVPNARWVAMRLIEGDPSIERALREGTLGELAQAPTSSSPGLIVLEPVS
jgi:ferrous iron transport protein B